MNPQRQYILAKLAGSIQQKIKKSAIVSYLIQIFNFAWIFILFIQQLKFQSNQQNQQYPAIQSFLDNYITSFIFLQSSCLSHLSLTFIFSILVIIHVSISQSFLKKQKHKALQEAILWTSTVIFFFLEILILPALHYTFKLIFQSQLTQGLSLSLLIGCSFYFLNCTVSTYSLYSQFTLLLIPCISNPETQYSQILIIIVSLYKFLKTNRKISKILYLLIATLFTNNLGQIIIGQDMNLYGCTTQFYLGCSVVFISCYVWYQPQNVMDLNKEEFFLNILQTTIKVEKTQKINKILKTHQILQIFEFISLKQNLFDYKYHERVMDQLSFEITFQHFHGICKEILERQSKNFTTYKQKFHLIELMMLTEKNLAQILIYIEQKEINITKMNNKQKIQFVRLFQKLKNNYGSFYQNNGLQVAYIIQTDKLIINLIQNLQKFVISQIQFWQSMLDKNICRTKLYNRYDNIYKQNQQLSKTKQKLQQNINAEKLLKMYNILEKDFNQYQESATDQLRGENSSSFGQNNTYAKSNQYLNEYQIQSALSSKYIIIANQKIEYVSQSLAEQLKQKSSSFSQARCQQLFGEQVSLYLANKIKFLAQSNISLKFSLPFIRKNNNFILTKAKILWYPTLDDKVLKYCISVEAMAKSTFLLYNISSKIITCYNSHFIQTFELSKKLIDNQIQKDQLSFSRLFGDSFSHTFLDSKENSKLQENSSVELQLNLKNLYSEQSRKKHKFLLERKAMLKVYDYIDTNTVKYAILQLHRIKDDSTSMRNKKNEDLPKPIKIEKNLKQVYQDENFFCPISNSCQSKISQKIASLKSSRNVRYFQWMILMTGILLSCCVAQNFYSYYQFSSRNSQYNSIQKGITRGSEQYILLYKMYKSSLKRYQVQAYRENVAKTRGKPASLTLAAATNNQITYLNTFIQNYLDNFRNKLNDPVKYNLSFAYFNISTSTEFSTMMDYVQNFRRNLEFNEYDFILRNYLAFRKVSIQFQKSICYEDQVENILFQNKIIYFVQISFILVLVLAIAGLSLKKQSSVKDLISIFELIKQQQIEQRITSLKTKFKTFFNNQQIRQKFKTQNVSHQKILGQRNSYAILGQISGQILSSIFLQQKQQSQYRGQNIFSTSAKQKRPSTSVSNFSKNIQQERQLILGQTQVNKKLKIKLKLNVQNQKTHQIKSLFLSVNMKYLTLLFIALIYCIELGLNMKNLSIEKQKIVQLFNYQQRIYNGVFNLNRLITDTGIESIYKHKYNQTISIPVTETLTINTKFQVSSQYEQIKQIQRAIQNALDSNICNYSIPSAGLQMMPCQYYGKGALTHGYSQSFAYVLDLSFKIKHLLLSQFQTQKCTTQYCPPYYQFDYMTMKLNSVTESCYSTFQNTFQKVSNNASFERFVQLQSKLAINILIALVLGFYIYFQCKSSQQTIQLFKIFPKNVVGKIRMTNYFRKHKILEILQNL